jgi:hypothetical protein
MNKGAVKSEGSALVYIVDCTLATVTSMAMRKKPPVHEFNRQISIAQTGVDWIRDFGIDPRTSRAAEVINDYNGEVWKWAEAYRPLDSEKAS